MKDIFSKLLGCLTVLLLLTAVVLSVSMRNAQPLTVGSFAAAEAQTEQFMNALCSGDYETAEGLISGGHSLAPAEEFSDPLTQTLWEAYTGSLSHTFNGGCYADQYGLYRDVTVTALDIPALMADLQRKTALTEDSLGDAAMDMIARGDYTMTHTLTLQLTGSGGHWQLLPTPQLIALMQGSMGGA